MKKRYCFETSLAAVHFALESTVMHSHTCNIQVWLFEQILYLHAEKLRNMQ